MKSRDCFWCEQPCLAYDPEGHEKFPCVCLNCGMRVSEEIPWWRDLASDLLRWLLVPALLTACGFVLILHFRWCLPGALLLSLGITLAVALAPRSCF